jgi:glycerate 2-kinase
LYFTSNRCHFISDIVKIIICPDKFKGSLTAREVCEAVGAGLARLSPRIVVESVPLADGGEGTCELLTSWHGGQQISLQVTGPLFTPVTARYGMSSDGATAFIEMAEASGLSIIPVEERNPLITTSFGTGELIADALNRGARNIVLGIGGSGTNDAGIGMASALGFEFFDAGGELLKPTGENLIHIRHFGMDHRHPELSRARITALCDVTNPLYGPDGAAYVYAPQKGANKVAVELLDAGLRNFRRVAHKHLRTSVDFPGAGAAGGLGAGARVFLNATIQKGIDHIIESTGLDEKICMADVVITGEGRLDWQTFSGKVVSEVLKLAEKRGKPVIAICGSCELTEDETLARGIARVISLVDDNTSSESAIQNAATYITRKIADECKGLPGFN